MQAKFTSRAYNVEKPGLQIHRLKLDIMRGKKWSITNVSHAAR